MPVWRLQTSFAADSTLPRDFMTITPHFNDGGVGSDPQGLCDDLAAALSGWINVGPEREVKVTAYDAQGTVPVYPAGEAIVNTGVAPTSVMPREIALCLSFYSDRNIPRQRGRLYMPVNLFSTAAALSVRPAGALQTKVGDLAAIFADLGGVDVDWCVWSRTNAIAYPITNWWVDDEWDVIRSRGLRSTTRTQGTVSDG